MKRAGLVGPNAVIQLAAALEGRPDIARAVFTRAGYAGLLDAPPTAMIDQSIPAALFAALYAELPAAQAGQVAQRAGWLTGQYILAHRIPRAAQKVLHILPARLGAHMLLRAILRHAWTFAGTGICQIWVDDVFRTQTGGLVDRVAEFLKTPQRSLARLRLGFFKETEPCGDDCLWPHSDVSPRKERFLGQISLLQNPMPMPGSLWHQGVFEALFSSIISPRIQVQHVSLGPRDDLFTLILVPRQLG